MGEALKRKTRPGEPERALMLRAGRYPGLPVCFLRRRASAPRMSAAALPSVAVAGAQSFRHYIGIGGFTPLFSVSPTSRSGPWPKHSPDDALVAFHAAAAQRESVFSVVFATENLGFDAKGNHPAGHEKRPSAG